jgi:serine/threonine-protein kinase
MSDSITPERWREIDELFARALDVDPADRPGFLGAACQGDAELLRAVSALLDQHRAAAHIIGDSALEFDPDLLSELEAADAADHLLHDAQLRVGPYRIVREIGRGGMGAVYLAERADGEFEKEVALKLVKRGMDTDEILARFRHERRILASLEHPSIARLYDGGVSDDGRPYIVMELVEGEPITSYCDRHRLSVDDRIALFQMVCGAVQYAHQKLVVHRDIKPSNILVGEDGIPKLLDFGIAKLLADEDLSSPRTRPGMRMLTPEFAAPEQLRGDPPSAASDVYALGAVLFELLAGRRALGSIAPGAREAEVGPGMVSVAATHPATERWGRGGITAAGGDPSPSQIAWNRSTTPERLRRSLAGDIDTLVLHALAPDPERRYGSTQQLLDDLERYRTGMPIHARPPTARYLAMKFVRRHRSALAASLVVLLTLVGGLAGILVQSRRAATERDAARQAQDASEQIASFLIDLFDSADPLGIRPERTDTMLVRELVDRGAARVESELVAQPALRAEMLTVLGRVYSNLGAYASAESMLEAAVAASEASAPGRSNPIQLALLAGAAKSQGHYARADSLLSEVIAIYAAGGSAADTLYVESLSERGLLLTNLGRYDEAQVFHDRALEQLRLRPDLPPYLHARARGNLAILHYEIGDYPEAERGFRETLELEQSYLAPDHPRLAASLNNVASSLHYQGRYEDAEPLYLKALEIGRPGLGDEHAEVGNYFQNLATLYDDQERYAEAEDLYRLSIRAHEATLGRDNPTTAMVLRNFALNRRSVGALAEAESLLREALAYIEASLGREHLYSAVTGAALGRVLTELNSLDEASDYVVASLALLEDLLPPEHHLVAVSRSDLGAHHLARGNYAEAEPLLLESYGALAEDRGVDHYLTRNAARHLHNLYTARGEPARAAEYAVTAE